jgi:hypothetical protein
MGRKGRGRPGGWGGLRWQKRESGEAVEEGEERRSNKRGAKTKKGREKGGKGEPQKHLEG